MSGIIFIIKIAKLKTNVMANRVKNMPITI